MDPDVTDEGSASSVLTGYDEDRLLTYVRLLDAAAEDADWREVARILLHIIPKRSRSGAFRAWESHLARTRRMTTTATNIFWQAGARTDP
ncbi:DUF2285 domain-containing protein [Mesorhizobium sp. f-mel]